MTKRVWHKGPPPHVSADELRQLFTYDPVTGIVRWAVSRAARIKVGDEAATKHDSGYKRVMVNNRNLYVHRIAWAITHGEFPEQIDHINGIRSDNRLVNLRGVTNLENCHNKCVQRQTNAGVPNVYFDKRYGTYKASVSANKSFYHLGCFKTLEEATKAVAEGRMKYQSHYYPANARVPRIAP